MRLGSDRARLSFRQPVAIFPSRTGKIPEEDPLPSRPSWLEPHFEGGATRWVRFPQQGSRTAIAATLSWRSAAWASITPTLAAWATWSSIRHSRSCRATARILGQFAAKCTLARWVTRSGATAITGSLKIDVYLAGAWIYTLMNQSFIGPLQSIRNYYLVLSGRNLAFICSPICCYRLTKGHAGAPV